LTLLKSFRAHTANVNHIKQLYLNNDYVATVSNDNTAKIWNISSTGNNWTLIQTFNLSHTSSIHGFDFIDDVTMTTGSADSTIKIWSICTALTIRTVNVGQGVYSLKYLKNGIHLAAGISNGNIQIFNINNGSLTRTLTGHSNKVWDLLLINESNILVSSSEDYSIRIWNLTTYTCKFTLTAHTSHVYGLNLVSTDIFASVSHDFSAKLWNIKTGTLIRTFTGHTNTMFWTIGSYDQTLISGSTDQSVKLWNISSGQVLKSVNTNLGVWSLTTLNTTKSDVYPNLLCFASSESRKNLFSFMIFSISVNI